MFWMFLVAIIAITLYGLSHIEDVRLKFDTLAPVHGAINARRTTDAKREIADNVISPNQISGRALITLRDNDPPFDPLLSTQCGRKKGPKPQCNGRGIGAKNVLSDQNNEATKKHLEQKEENYL